jgi:hypothetical protein
MPAPNSYALIELCRVPRSEKTSGRQYSTAHNMTPTLGWNYCKSGYPAAKGASLYNPPLLSWPPKSTDWRA